jgi:protein-S-isoprenylcysteine O-methyltransferase Ste14
VVCPPKLNRRATLGFVFAEACMVWFKTLIFTIIVPGAVIALIPYLLLSRDPSSFANIGALQLFGLIPMAIGAAIYFRCAWDFASAGKGTPAPIDPPKRLVARGLYRFVRNPMYVGVLLTLLGEAWLFGSRALLAYAAIVFTWEHLFVVFYEEPALKRKFGESYSDYLARTPRWIPRFNSLARRGEL